ncbi:HDL536Cp [Eremothecium sinecaudum]|uniref:CBK1 kinase activator protein MOB2 n=1 Tax=Eremothecium sinecaudum TaxID=45286 RepID=A0A109UZF3_9SACH|nr:HDL536Cp [Eremothecium sinecaudum]AMD20208.1 HDL536Cp [Eremothecium sinecaudum]
MSFINSLKGFGRTSKKNKGSPTRTFQATTVNSIYGTPQGNGSRLSLRKGRSPTRRPAVSQVPQSQQQQQQVENDSIQSQEVMFLSEPFVRTALVKGSFKTIVQLPKYVDLGEWIALNVFEFYTNLSQFYGVIAEYVTPEAYPMMNAGPSADYLWLDANNRQVALPAGQYIDLGLTWINNKVNDKNLFPTQSGQPFSKNFLRDIQRIMIQMFRIFAHIYHHHFDKIVHLSLEAHWNSFFAHYISFAKEFNFLDRKEMYPLEPLIESFEMQGKII